MPDISNPAGIFESIPPYLIREGFLGADLVAKLIDYAAENESRFQNSTTGITANERVRPDWRVSSLLRSFAPLKQEIKPLFNAALPEALQVLGMSGFDLYHTELELVAHGNGAFYNTHIDTAIDKDDESVRVLTAVYYFHAEPKAFHGGNLRLLPLRHNAAEDMHLDIEPLNDRLLLFPSWVPHRVMPVVSDSTDFRDSRFAINCWYRKRKA
ncbi:MAG TPA: 2OG-Fe(II) oxygenase [Pseudomonas sp.]|nr:2OG-Fe(II) oxygenase [Pseudomonas sp.]